MYLRQLQSTNTDSAMRRRGGGARARRGTVAGGLSASSFGRWASTGESYVGSAGKTTAASKGVVYLFGGIVMVSSHSDQLYGCVSYAVALAAVCIAGIVMVAWLAITKQGRQWRHGGVAGGSWLLLVPLVVKLG